MASDINITGNLIFNIRKNCQACKVYNMDGETYELHVQTKSHINLQNLDVYDEDAEVDTDEVDIDEVEDMPMENQQKKDEEEEEDQDKENPEKKELQERCDQEKRHILAKIERSRRKKAAAKQRKKEAKLNECIRLNELEMKVKDKEKKQFEIQQARDEARQRELKELIRLNELELANKEEENKQLELKEEELRLLNLKEKEEEELRLLNLKEKEEEELRLFNLKEKEKEELRLLNLKEKEKQKEEEELRLSTSRKRKSDEMEAERSLPSNSRFFRVKINDDGNCLFASISDQIYGDSRWHMMLRFLCYYYLSKNPELSQFENLRNITDGFEWGKWAGEMEIKVFSILFNCRIDVYDRNMELMISHGNPNRPEISLFYTGQHYDSLRMLEKTSRLRPGLRQHDCFFPPGTFENNILKEIGVNFELPHSQDFDGNKNANVKIKSTYWNCDDKKGYYYGTVTDSVFTTPEMISNMTVKYNVHRKNNKTSFCFRRVLFEDGDDAWVQIDLLEDDVPKKKRRKM